MGHEYLDFLGGTVGIIRFLYLGEVVEHATRFPEVGSTDLKPLQQLLHRHSEDFGGELVGVLGLAGFLEFASGAGAGGEQTDGDGVAGYSVG